MTLLFFVLVGVYAAPFVVSAVIRFISAERMLGGSPGGRDFATRVKVVATFMNGLAAGVLGYDPSRRHDYKSTTAFSRPFYVEGAYAGLHLAQYLAPWRARRNLRIFRERHERFIFLLTIGSGFSYGMTSLRGGLNENPKAIKGVDPRLRLLFFDGYAFEKFVFGGRNNPSRLDQGLSLGPTPRSGFYEGAGRALWFVLPEFTAFLAYIAKLPSDCMANCHMGYGMACGFAGCERVADGALLRYPREILDSPDFHCGLIIGLFARYYIDPEFVKMLLAKNHSALLNELEGASALFDDFWVQGSSYEEWRKALRDRLASQTVTLRYLHHEIAPTIGA